MIKEVPQIDVRWMDVARKRRSGWRDTGVRGFHLVLGSTFFSSQLSVRTRSPQSPTPLCRLLWSALFQQIRPFCLRLQSSRIRRSSVPPNTRNCLLACHRMLLTMVAASGRAGEDLTVSSEIYRFVDMQQLHHPPRCAAKVLPGHMLSATFLRSVVLCISFTASQGMRGEEGRDGAE